MKIPRLSLMTRLPMLYRKRLQIRAGTIVDVLTSRGLNVNVPTAPSPSVASTASVEPEVGTEQSRSPRLHSEVHEAVPNTDVEEVHHGHYCGERTAGKDLNRIALPPFL